MLNFKDVSVDDVLKEMDKLNFKSVKDAFNFNESLFKGPKRDYKKDRLRLFYCNCNFYFAFYEVINEIIYQYFHIDYRVRPEVMKHQSCYFLDNFISWVKINLSGHISEYILVIKPKQEILKIAEDYAENVNAHKQIFTETEFISFIGNLCIDESELSRSNSRKRY